MDIAKVSMSMNNIRIKQEVGVSLAKMVIDSAKMEGADILKMMEVNTEIMANYTDINIGENIDIYA